MSDAATTPIGRLLVERGVVKLADVEEAAQSAMAAQSRICSVLLDRRLCDEGDLASVLGERHGIPGVDLSRSVIDLAAVDLVPRNVAESDLLLPLAADGERVHIAVDSPTRAQPVVDEVRFITTCEVSVYVAVLSALRAAIAACYDARARGETTWRGPAARPDASAYIAQCAPGSVALGAAGAGLAAAESRADAPPPIAASGEELIHVVTVPARARRVLVVDDEPAIRMLAQRALEHHGFSVETAADGAEALARVGEQRFDLVLLDAMLPKVHGFEVARRLRSDPVTRGLPVIIMSAVHRGWRFAQDARQSYGAQDYVEKPFRVDDLLRRIEAVLEARPRHAESAPVADLVSRGRAAMAGARVDDAVSAFEQAVAVDPFSADAHHGLGEALRSRGEAFRAMTQLERAVELSPDLLAALRTLADLYLQKGFRTKAAEALERAVAVAPDARARDQLRRELMRLL